MTEIIVLTSVHTQISAQTQHWIELYEQSLTPYLTQFGGGLHSQSLDSY